MSMARENFNPPAPCGAGHPRDGGRPPPPAFQSTRPLRGRTRAGRTQGDAESFQSTRPLRGGTLRTSLTRNPVCNFNPPAPCGAGLIRPIELNRRRNFNPPAPCGAGHCDPYVGTRPVNFNPPAPCGAGPSRPLCSHPPTLFQSTRPLRGGTQSATTKENRARFQSTRPLRGGTQQNISILLRSQFQSTRPLRGGTFKPDASYAKSGLFQSTRPLRGGTAILHKKTVQNIAYCTKSAFTLAVLSGFLALMRPFFCQTCTNFGANLPKNRCSLPVRTLIPSGPPPADSRH